MFAECHRMSLYNDMGFHRACRWGGFWEQSWKVAKGFCRDCLGGGKEGVRQITNSAEERKTVAEGGFIHYI